MKRDMMDCREAVDHLWELIDRELDEQAESRIEAHLEACQHCFPQYDFHRAFRAFLGSRCRQSAPAELRRRIFLSLLAEERNAAARRP